MIGIPWLDKLTGALIMAAASAHYALGDSWIALWVFGMSIVYCVVQEIRNPCKGVNNETTD